MTLSPPWMVGCNRFYTSTLHVCTIRKNHLFA